MDGSREQPLMTAGLDLGDKYSYSCASSINTAARLWKLGLKEVITRYLGAA